MRTLTVCSPSVHQFFGIDNSSGLAGAMRNGAHPDKAIVPAGDGFALDLVPGGDLQSDSVGQLLEPSKFSALLSALSDRADIILLDCPAVFEGVETAMLADRVDASLLVTGSGVASREDMRRAAILVSSCKAAFLGVIVNDGVRRR